MSIIVIKVLSDCPNYNLTCKRLDYIIDDLSLMLLTRKNEQLFGGHRRNEKKINFLCRLDNSLNYKIMHDCQMVVTTENNGLCHKAGKSGF